MRAKEVLSSTTSPSEAARAAERLIGQYGHLKPGDPDTFARSVAAVLSQYPFGLVQECIDPRIGAARMIKFLSIADLVTWLDGRLEHYRALAAYVPREQLPAPPAKVFPAGHKITMRERWAKLLAQIFAAGSREDPVTKLRREAREAAEIRLDTDRRRALDELAASGENQ